VTLPLAGITQEVTVGSGVPVPPGKPRAIAEEDVAHATHIFAIGCTLPAKAAASGKAADWSDVPDDQGYGPMRDAIVRHVTALLDELQNRLQTTRVRRP